MQNLRRWSSDVRTLESDWERIGVAFKNARSERLDYHALRHTFQTLLDQTGCSRATKKRLMRHAAEDVTDGYAHAELAEMLEAMKRLPSPLTPAAQAATVAKTGTDDSPVAQNGAPRADNQLDKAGGIQRTSSAPIDTLIGEGVTDPRNMPTCRIVNKDRQKDTHRDSQNTSDLIGAGAGDNVAKPGPSTQVD